MAITAGVDVIEYTPGFSDWQQVGPGVSYLKVQDAATVTDPDTQITSSTRQVFGRVFTPGTFLGLRMRYVNKPVSTDPVIKVFGRTRQPDGTAGPWQILKNRLGDASVTIVTDDSDIVSDIGYATTADPEASYYDVQGCNEFIVGVEIACSDEDAALDAKFL